MKTNVSIFLFFFAIFVTSCGYDPTPKVSDGYISINNGRTVTSTPIPQSPKSIVIELLAICLQGDRLIVTDKGRGSIEIDHPIIVLNGHVFNDHLRIEDGEVEYDNEVYVLQTVPDGNSAYMPTFWSRKNQKFAFLAALVILTVIAAIATLGSTTIQDADSFTNRMIPPGK